MILDYRNGNYFLRVPRDDGDACKKMLMTEHGFDFSITGSSRNEAVMFTKEPYAAASFYRNMTPAAEEQLRGIVKEIEASWQPSSKISVACPPDKQLWDFQRADIEYALRRKNTLIGDQPGLGKTPIAICFANEVRAKRVLVVCPASIRIQWVERIWEWSTIRPHRDLKIHPILKSQNGTDPAAHYTVASYEMVRDIEILASLIRDGRFDVVILDEIHYLKETDALRTRAIFGGGSYDDPLHKHCGRIIGLSGTPLLNRPREAYTVCRALDWDSIGWLSEQAFKDRFNPSLKGEVFDPETGRTKVYIDERSGRFGELQNRLRGNFMTRHLKREVMTQLKLPIYDLIHVDETRAVKQALEAESLLDIDPETFQFEGGKIDGAVSTVRRMMGMAMAPQVADWIDMLIEGGEEKLVVFAWHHEVLDYLEQRWQKHGVIRVDGKTSPRMKDHLIKEYVRDRKLQVALGNHLSLGTGTDGLQHVSCHALIAEPDWTPGINIQCFDRLDRGGQQRTVQGDIFVAPGSFAERVLASALRKGQAIHKTLDRVYA